MAVLTDEELVYHAAKGDAAAFDNLYERYKNPVVSFARGYLEYRNLAEDVAQDALLSAYLRIWQFDPERGSFRAWLFGIVHNQCRQEARRRRWLWWNTAGTEELEKTIEIPSHCWPDNDTNIGVRAALRCLPEKHRSAVILTKVQGLSIEECAQALGITQNNVKQRVFRGVMALRKILKGETPLPGA
ncbi:MAG: RNA polymerase sigma factor [Acidobacteriota bacterium]|jgi:RNA polymerase sigma-70 factor (ECF subfamily)